MLIPLLTSAVLMCGSPTETLRVWPGETPQDSRIGYYGPLGPERVRTPDDSPTRTAKWITSVTTPTLTVFRAQRAANGIGLIICPGGGYWNLAWDLEGEEVARWAAAQGMTAYVLKYRVPRRNGQPEELPAPGPLLDIQRAVRIVRSRAKNWGVDPQKIGVVGFSAGGHLALAAATMFDRPAYSPLDAVDMESCRPNFAVAVYPGYLVEKDTGRLAPYMRIPADTPPIMLVHAEDDTTSSSENSVVMHQSLKKAGISSELHVYERGGHGFGVRPTALACSRWHYRMQEWLVGLRLAGQRGKSGLSSSPPLKQFEANPR